MGETMVAITTQALCSNILEKRTSSCHEMNQWRWLTLDCGLYASSCLDELILLDLGRTDCDNLVIILADIISQ